VNPNVQSWKVHTVIPIMAVPENSGLIVRDATEVFCTCILQLSS
jgi:hypothetical protein